MGLIEGFQPGQVSLGDFATQQEATKAQVDSKSKLGKLFAGKTMEPYRKKGYTLGIAHAAGRWHVVLNPPGVSSYR